MVDDGVVGNVPVPEVAISRLHVIRATVGPDEALKFPIHNGAMGQGALFTCGMTEVQKESALTKEAVLCRKADVWTDRTMSKASGGRYKAKLALHLFHKGSPEPLPINLPANNNCFFNKAQT